MQTNFFKNADQIFCDHAGQLLKMKTKILFDADQLLKVQTRISKIMQTKILFDADLSTM